MLGPPGSESLQKMNLSGLVRDFRDSPSTSFADVTDIAGRHLWQSFGEVSESSDK